MRVSENRGAHEQSSAKCAPGAEQRARRGFLQTARDPEPQGQIRGTPALTSAQGPHPHPEPYNLPAWLSPPKCRRDGGAREAYTGSLEAAGCSAASPLQRELPERRLSLLPRHLLGARQTCGLAAVTGWDVGKRGPGREVTQSPREALHLC